MIEEKGPWAAAYTNDKAFIESDDFTHDVRLYVSGDFESIEQRVEYAEEIAKRLNVFEIRDAEVEQLRKQLVAFNNNRKTAYQRHKEARTKLVQQLAANNPLLDEAADELDRQKAEIESLRQQVDNLTEANRIMCEDFAAENNKVYQLEQQLANSQLLVEQRQAELASVMRANSNKLDTIQRLNKQLAIRDAEVAGLRDQVTELQGQVGLLLRTAKALAATEPKP